MEIMAVMIQVVLSLTLLLLPGLEAIDECSRFNIGGPCSLLPDQVPEDTSTTSTDPLTSYCATACSYNLGSLYDDICSCTCTRSYMEGLVCDGANATCTTSRCETDKQRYNLVLTNNAIQTCDCELQDTTVPDCAMSGTNLALCLGLNAYGLLPAGVKCDCLTTPPPPTTTTTEPAPRFCYYTKNRPPTLTSRRKRIFQGSSAPSCEYPGIVGLYSNLGGALAPACTGLLISEDRVLVDALCVSFVSAGIDLHALTSSYSVGDVSTFSPKVVPNSAVQLNLVAGQDFLYSVQLDTPLTFDSACVTPACVPNNLFDSSQLNLANCRMLGYGNIDDANNLPTTLQEISVFVDPSSVSTSQLQLLRVDGAQGFACFNEFAAPVVCSHSVSNEWVAVGFTSSVGFPCSDASLQTLNVQPLFKEAFGGSNGYFNALQTFPYVNNIN